MPDLLTPADYINQDPAPGDLRIAYGELPDQYGDLFLPSIQDGARPYPVVALLHGGCWRQQFGAAPMGQMARHIANQGIAVWNLEYRRLGGSGGWPNTFLDAGAGLDHLADIAADHNLDLGRVAAVGHSAGGHLALWLAGRDGISPASELYTENPQPLTAVVSLAGIGDLGHALATGICRGAPGELMGGGPDDHPKRYTCGSPHALLPLRTPQWHVVGSQDALVPPDHVERFVELARASGDHAVLERIGGAGHFEVVMPHSTAFGEVQTSIVDLFR